MRWATRYPKLTDWVEAHIGETLNFYSLPRQHHKHLKSTNMLERLNEEIKRRTRVVRIFPNAASCLRLVRALCAETHEGWLEDHRYLNMEFLKEQKKDRRKARGWCWRTSVSQSWKVTGHFFRLYLRPRCPGRGHNRRIL